jgi:hypothetical protein
MELGRSSVFPASFARLRSSNLDGHNKTTKPVSSMAIVQYYAIWWESKIVHKKVGRKFWQKP